MRVLIVAPAPVGDERIGGIANFIRGFVRCAPDDFEIEIVGAAVAGDGARREWQTVTLGGREVRFLAATRLGAARRTGRIPTKARIVAGMLRDRRRIATNGRVVQVHAPAMDIGLLGRKAPVIRVVHNAPRDLATQKGESTWSRVGRLLHAVEGFTFRRVSEIYFVDRATRDEYARDEPERADHMHYLSNGVDADQFHPLGAGERDARRAEFGAAYGLDAGARWLLFAGRLDTQKDPELLVRGFAAYSARPTAAQALLIVAGEGNLRARTGELAAELGVAQRVRFVGVLPHADLARLMPAADAFVMSSAFEAAPFVVFEALASGLPVVSTSVGEVPRIVSDRSTGWIASEHSAEAIADGISWALSQPFAEISERCCESARPYRLQNVLAPFYAAHRVLAASYAT